MMASMERESVLEFVEKYMMSRKYFDCFPQKFMLQDIGPNYLSIKLSLAE